MEGSQVVEDSQVVVGLLPEVGVAEEDEEGAEEGGEVSNRNILMVRTMSNNFLNKVYSRTSIKHILVSC